MPILLLDKPSGITSFQALRECNNLFAFTKYGHGGTLDPKATGLLPIFIDHDTIFSKICLLSSKKYEVICHLGVSTTTYDTEGELIECESKNIEPSIDKILESLKIFTGSYNQLPPIYSAVKINGKRLYSIARTKKNETLKSLKVKPRPITIYSIDLLNYIYPFLNLQVVCSSGTYVRSLVNDLGNYLHCGAHVSTLRRLGVSCFNSKMYTLDQLSSCNQIDREALLIQTSDLISEQPHILLSDYQIKKLSNGQKISYHDLIDSDSYLENQEYLLASTRKKLVGFGLIQDQFLKPTRMISNHTYN
ncbi:MAG: tRNA pseudouridine(55) synthase TruB [Methylacidiphilales bacterium]|nr:tRNA pseudouridine(55) synthase TruB [Candidatus Methylacidiphilales bacterium]